MEKQEKKKKETFVWQKNELKRVEKGKKKVKNNKCRAA